MIFNLQDFIATYVVKRKQSMFLYDINVHKEQLSHGIEGKKVLVIGGAGSIGSSFIKALLPYHPSSLTVVDINENALTELSRDLRSEKGLYVPDDYITYPMSYANPVFEKIFRKHKGYDIVANFSAHKHVRSEKDQYAVEVLIENNVLLAAKLLTLLQEFPPEHYFCVSTDKAANPVNIMGASKKIMEEMIMAYADFFPVTTARFANVAFSNGSLPAGFLERIQKMQPISAPSDVTRYFVSPEESGQICLMACVLGKSGQIYFPKLDTHNVMTFSEISNALLQEMGYEVIECATEKEALERSQILKEGSKEYPVFYAKSDTTGEKAYEEFYTQNEKVDLDTYHSIGIILNPKKRTLLELEMLYQAFHTVFAKTDFTKEEIVQIIQNFLGNFNHLETGKYLDAKM